MTDTHTEALKGLLPRIGAEIARQREEGGDMMTYGQPDKLLVDIRAAIEALPARNDERALKLVEALRSAGEQMLSDYQTSEQHHPNHVLVPLRAFEDLRSALADTQPSGETR